MELVKYLKGKDRAEFAKKIRSTKNYVNLLCCKQRRASPELSLKIQKASDEKVTILELLFPHLNSDALLELILSCLKTIKEGQQTDESEQTN